MTRKRRTELELVNRQADAYQALPQVEKEKILSDILDRKPDRKMLCMSKAALTWLGGRLTEAEIGQLYDIVVCEHENWDGEEMPSAQIVQYMVSRYQSVGLAPSRN